MAYKAIVWILVLGFVVVGGLLVTNHFGYAIKITNYLFYLLTVLVLYTVFEK